MKLFPIFPLFAIFSFRKKLIVIILYQICQIGILLRKNNFFRKGLGFGLDN